jgi:succinate-semialdehyde dehydrogenase/glutarate-semialdehyde dehydrogenase
MQQASETVKRVSMELGGNACFVVFEDADVDQAVEAAMVSKFRNAGQTCVCADRFLIHASVYEEFNSKLAVKVRTLRVGPGIDPETQIGPLISAKAAESVADKVKAAVKEGATLLEEVFIPDALGPHYYPPTILTNVSRGSDIWRTETFGPVAAIMSFETEEEALDIANDSPVGLASYFCTKDLSRAFRFAHK